MRLTPEICFPSPPLTFFSAASLPAGYPVCGGAEACPRSHTDTEQRQTETWCSASLSYCSLNTDKMLSLCNQHCKELNIYSQIIFEVPHNFLTHTWMKCWHCEALQMPVGLHQARRHWPYFHPNVNTRQSAWPKTNKLHVLCEFQRWQLFSQVTLHTHHHEIIKTTGWTCWSYDF